jgi:hypothetical protein
MRDGCQQILIMFFHYLRNRLRWAAKPGNAHSGCEYIPLRMNRLEEVEFRTRHATATPSSCHLGR